MPQVPGLLLLTKVGGGSEWNLFPGLWPRAPNTETEMSQLTSTGVPDYA